MFLAAVKKKKKYESAVGKIKNVSLNKTHLVLRSYDNGKGLTVSYSGLARIIDKHAFGLQTTGVQFLRETRLAAGKGDFDNLPALR